MPDLGDVYWGYLDPVMVDRVITEGVGGLLVGADVRGIVAAPLVILLIHGRNAMRVVHNCRKYLKSD